MPPRPVFHGRSAEACFFRLIFSVLHVKLRQLFRVRNGNKHHTMLQFKFGGNRCRNLSVFAESNYIDEKLFTQVQLSKALSHPLILNIHLYDRKFI